MLEQFARLNAKKASLLNSGVAPLLEVSDLCGVLASLKEHHSWYIYAQIDQRRSYNMDLLHRYIQQFVLQEMYQRKFKLRTIKPSEFSYGVTKATLYTHFTRKGKCRECNGLGFKGSIHCIKCDGAGMKAYNWADKLEYAFPMHKELTRKWYRTSCGHYDQFICSILAEIQNDLIQALSRVNKQAIQFKRQEEIGDLFDDS